MNHLFLLTLLLPGIAPGGEPVTMVPLRSHDNSLVLTISNASTSREASRVTVAVTRAPRGVVFRPVTVTPSPIPPLGEGRITLSFDVSPQMPPGLVDTVELTVRAGTSQSWSRSLVWRFIGPDSYRLDQNHPNPFNPTTTIPYALPSAADVSLTVYDRLGRLVIALVTAHQEAGYHTAVWNGRTASGADAATGVYYCRLRAASFSSVIRMLLLK